MSQQSVIQNSSSYISHPGLLSSLRYHKIPLSNVSSNKLTINLSSINLGEFRISGGQVMNLGKSFVGYNYTVPATAAKYNVVHEQAQDFCNSVSFGDAAGINLCDIQFARNYVKMVRSLRTSEDEFNAMDRENSNYKSKALKSSNVLPFSRDGLIASLANSYTKDYDEVQYLRISPNVNQALTVNRLLPLSCFKDTFIGMDKNIVFAQETFLRFNSMQANQICFQTTTPANPHDGASEIAVGDIPPSFNNCFLYLALEQNDQLIAQVQNKMMASGIRMSIPYQYGYRTTSGSGASTSAIMHLLTQQFGTKLKRIITAPFNGLYEKNAYTYDHSNVNGSKVNSVRSSMDSTFLTENALTCFNPDESNNPAAKWVFPTADGASGGSFAAEDYLHHRQMLMGSAMPSYSEYQTNWFYADIFGMNGMLKHDSQSVPDDDINDGFDLVGVNKVYNVQFENAFAANATANYGTGGANTGLIAYYTFVYFVKDVLIDREGIKWI